MGMDIGMRMGMVMVMVMSKAPMVTKRPRDY